MPDFSPMLLLVGPLLRRVTATEVNVWVATSQPCTVTLDVYGSVATLDRAAGAQPGTVATSTTQVGTGHRDTGAVGTSLHAAVVTAPIAGVPPDSICSYNVTLAVQGAGSDGWSGSWDLGGLKLLDVGDAADDYAAPYLLRGPRPLLESAPAE